MKLKELEAGKIIGLLTPIIILGGLTYFFRPWLHGMLIGIYSNPYLLQVAGLTVLGVAIAGKTLAEKLQALDSEEQFDAGRANVWLLGISVLLVPLLVFGMPLSNAFEMEELAGEVQDNANKLQSLPDIDPQRPRVLPKSVAEEYASNSLQTPRYTLGDADISISDNGTPYWSMPKKPDGLYNYFALEQKGATFVDMTTQNKRISYTEDEMEAGLGMGVTDNVMWRLKKEKYWVKYEDPINIEHDGKTYIAVPYKDYEFHFDSPIFYTTPDWSGVALVNPEGNIDFLEPEEARQNEVLQDQRLYPYDLAKKKVSSLAYKNGIINAWFTHRDQLEVAGVPGVGNDQPFTILTQEGVKLFVAAEPYGNAQGLFQIWTIDADTGDYSVLKLNRSEALLGANKATNYVRKANSKVNWADISSSSENVQTGFKPSEPIPVVVNDQLYWQVRVVPLDSAGIAFTSFVNAQSGDVINAETDQQIIDFLQNEEVENGTPTEGNQTSGETTEGVWNVVVMENGELVNKIEIGENQSVRFEKKD
ncbi:MAG: hypothetical protein H8Z69_01390 [Nanohaloarchaea archaeon]|nr:hypothetical protein [Candidatus Nanohaloarchaea archaeon]